MFVNAFRVTGAHAGLDKDVARRLALRDDAQARAAQADPQRIAGRSVFELLHGDTIDVASARGSEGSRRTVACSPPLFDQATVVAHFGDNTIQDHAYASIHSFLPSNGKAVS